ncbi:MAG: hypothetical protein JW874_07615, partial [Spirochaetales bacterium]|nr:hypothetical protein [Spirochaetales bacterium]
LKIEKKDTIFEKNEIHMKASFRFAQVRFIPEIIEELQRIISDYKDISTYEVVIEPLKVIPPVYNDETESEEAYLVLKDFIGNSVVQIRNEYPPHGCDDFAYFQNELTRGIFFFLGAANIEKGIKAGLHNPDFDIDEDCLEFGVKTMAMYLFELMNNDK